MFFSTTNLQHHATLTTNLLIACLGLLKEGAEDVISKKVISVDMVDPKPQQELQHSFSCQPWNCAQR